MLASLIKQLWQKTPASEPDGERGTRELLSKLAETNSLLSQILNFSYGQLSLISQQRVEQILSKPPYDDPKRLESFGFKAYSQNEEDGIIEEIFRRIGTTTRTFVEFGVEDGLENNTLYLLYAGWRGLWIEADQAKHQSIIKKFSAAIAAGQLVARHSFITTGNINSLIADSGMGREVDLLSIDIDGNDYHVLEAIECIVPRAIVIEYNAKFRPPLSVVTRYDSGHVWDGSDYMGASLSAVAILAGRKGYTLVGTNITGSNAFFVRSDLVSDKFSQPATPEHLYNPARYRLGTGFDIGHRPNFGDYTRVT
jgi:hypothetical protein